LKKNFKFGFSYIELVYAMAIISIFMAVSVPFLTKRTTSANISAFGEYHCWAEYDEVYGWQLKQKSRYNQSAFSADEVVQECVFERPNGATNYEVTLVGGGGGGSLSTFKHNTNSEFYNNIIIAKSNVSQGTTGEFSGKNSKGEYATASCTSSKCTHSDGSENNNGYTSYTQNNKLEYTPGGGGDTGEVIKFKTSLNGAFDENGQIVIGFCDTDWQNPDYDNNYTTKNKHCIGKGGIGAEVALNKGNKALGSYYRMLKIVDDLRCQTKGCTLATYYGTGDGVINSYDIAALNLLKNHPAKIYIEQGTVSSYEAIIEEVIDEINNNKYEKAYNTLKTLLGHFKMDGGNIDLNLSDGYNGDYTRFVTENTVSNMYCKSGNCLVPGGEGGRSSEMSSVQVEAEEYNNHYYVFGDKDINIKTKSAGKFDSDVASNAGTIGAIYCREGLGNQSNSKYLATCPEPERISQAGHVKYANYGAGGGGGGFTMWTNANLKACNMVHFENLNYESDIYLNECDMALEYVSKTYNLQQTDGGNGASGAIIIKW